MKRELKMITAGAFAGILSGSFGWLFGQVNGRGMILGIFLSIGVIMIEKTSQQKLALHQYPEISNIMKAAIFSGILAGLIGYYTVFKNESSTDFGVFYLPYFFSYPKFILLMTLYPLLILPAFFSKSKYLLTVVTGTWASIIIELCRYGKMDAALSSSLYSGFAFTLLWVIFVGACGNPNSGKE